jgi:type I restriction enzyme M protein
VDFYRKMRKSLGNKRNEIGDPDQIDEITRIYGAFEEGEHCKIFDNEDFGFRKITVERPLRLSFAVTPERIEALRVAKAFEGLAVSKRKGKEGAAEIEAGLQLQKDLLAALGAMPAGMVGKSRAVFEADLDQALAKDGLRVPGPVRKAILSALCERDETAEICMDADGNPEPDPDLRDTENVPLKEDIHEYFDHEVKPHVADAWIDDDKTKVGYEIPFTRHFYKYVPPRPLEEIEAEIRQLEGEIVKALAAVGR